MDVDLETFGVAMQAAGAVVAAVQVGLYGVSERAHAEQRAPGDRLATWLTRYASPQEFSAFTARLRRSKFGGCALFAGSLVLFFVGAFVFIDLIEELLFRLPIGGDLAQRPWYIQLGNFGVVVLVAGGIIAGVYLSGGGLAAVVAPWAIRRLLAALHWWGRHLEASLRWAALLFGLGAVLELLARV